MAHATHEQCINWQEVGDETITTVRDLLRLDTRNPPGNEVRAATYLQTLFAAEGIAGEIVGPSQDRGTFIARLKGDGSANLATEGLHILAVRMTDAQYIRREGKSPLF